MIPSTEFHTASYTYQVLFVDVKKSFLNLTETFSNEWIRLLTEDIYIHQIDMFGFKLTEPEYMKYFVIDIYYETHVLSKDSSFAAQFLSQWHQLKKEFCHRSSCYTFYSHVCETVTDAELQCLQDGGHLVSINDHLELLIIIQNLALKISNEVTSHTFDSHSYVNDQYSILIGLFNRCQVHILIYHHLILLTMQCI